MYVYCACAKPHFSGVRGNKKGGRGMVTLLSHKEEKHSSPNSLKWTDGCLSSRESPILHWNGQMEMTGLAASHTLEKKEAFHGPPLLWKIALLSPKWTDGCPSSREFPILQWNGLMEMPGLAASHTSEDESLLCILKWY